MSKSDDTKKAYLAAMSAYVLKHGFGEASLRPLAKAAGTSDRMLIYHFGNKDRLMAELIAGLATDFTAGLNTVLPEVPFPSRRALLDAVLAVVRSDDLHPYVRVWQEMTALAAKGEAAHIGAGQAIVDGFVDWLSKRMPDGDPDPNGTASAMLTLIEGIHVMDTVGRDKVVSDAVDAIYPKT